MDLRAKPFNLNAGQIAWVKETLGAMGAEEKVGQLFCAGVSSLGKKEILKLTEKYKIGSLMIRPMKVRGLQGKIHRLQSRSKIPLLIAANLESGGSGAIAEGTMFAMPEGCAASGDIENGYRLGKTCCREAASVGINWSFAPVVDIDMSYRNPITNVRSFGRDESVVAAMAAGYLRAAEEEGVIATLKHFPGDGTDERDQHLLVAVNGLGFCEWMKSYGRVYRRLIERGAPCVMAAHIAQPAVVRKMNPEASDFEAFLPASLSKVLTTDLLRDELGFNGVIVTDSSLMVGFMQKMPRRMAVPLCIENGCDVMLFAKNIEEDYGYMLAGYRDGRLSEKRLGEAVTRILALKASRNLHVKHAKGTIVSNINPLETINLPQTEEWVRECADKSVTLVKDGHGLLPLSPKKTRRVYLNVIENYVSNNSAFARGMKRRLEKEGFAVTLRKRKLSANPNLMLKGIMTPGLFKALKEAMEPAANFAERHDLCVIVLNMETVSSATTARVDWKVLFGLGNDVPWYAGEIPLVVVSFSNPYHLLDIPMSHVYVNAYTANEATIDAVIEKLMGRSEFKGVSPIDPFCGHEDCEL